MALKAGTVQSFRGTLGEAIEAAFAAEMMAVKGQPLPDFGVEERRILFAAVAQAVLGYLKKHEAELLVRGPSLPSGTHVSVGAPSLTVTRGPLQAAGSGGWSGAVTLRWNTGSHAGSASASGGSFGSVPLALPGGTPVTRILVAQDSRGNAAVAEVFA
jgi:hypothetical protein